MNFFHPTLVPLPESKKSVLSHHFLLYRLTLYSRLSVCVFSSLHPGSDHIQFTLLSSPAGATRKRSKKRKRVWHKEQPHSHLKLHSSQISKVRHTVVYTLDSSDILANLCIHRCASPPLPPQPVKEEYILFMCAGAPQSKSGVYCYCGSGAPGCCCCRI